MNSRPYAIQRHFQASSWEAAKLEGAEILREFKQQITRDERDDASLVPGV